MNNYAKALIKAHMKVMTGVELEYNGNKILNELTEAEAGILEMIIEEVGANVEQG